MSDIHPDDLAIDRFAAAMKEKMAASRAKGRSGWEDRDACSDALLAGMLVGHLPKGNRGNFEDVANLAMMLHQRGADPAVLAAAAGPRGQGIYIASRAEHGAEWRALREEGSPIISTWIDECGAGETSDWPHLWDRCVREASSCAALVIVRKPDETLKGALVEAGAALSHGVPVYAVGLEGHSFLKHPLVTPCEDLGAALDKAEHAAALAVLKSVGATVSMMGGQCPFQAEGTIDGEPFYFRARGAHWRMGIGGDPVSSPAWSVEGEYGTSFEAGWMTAVEAASFMRDAVSQWREERGNENDHHGAEP